MMRLFALSPQPKPKKQKPGTHRLACESPTPRVKIVPDLSEYMTTKEAAHELGFTIPGVHKLIKKAKLDALLVGRIYLVSKKSVQSYLEETQGMNKNDPTRGKSTEE